MKLKLYQWENLERILVQELAARTAVYKKYKQDLALQNPEWDEWDFAKDDTLAVLRRKQQEVAEILQYLQNTEF